MTHGSTLSTLETWPPESLATLVSVLTDRAIATDEDETELSSGMIEGWNASCDRVLARHGYQGGAISTIGKFFPEAGAIYCIYDARRIDLKGALRYLERRSKRH